MKKEWAFSELMEHFTLSSDEQKWLGTHAAHNQLGLAVSLKVFQYQGRLPDRKHSIAIDIVSHVAIQLGMDADLFEQYQWAGRTASRHRQAIHTRLGFREVTQEDGEQLTQWLSQHPVLYQEQRLEVLIDILYQYCREQALVPPTRQRLERLARSAVARHEQHFFAKTMAQLSSRSRLALDNLTFADDTLTTNYEDGTVLGWLKNDPGQTGVTSLKTTADRLKRLQAIELPETLFANTATRIVKEYSRRAATEAPRELRRRENTTRFTLLAAFCWVRQREITDQLVDLLIRLVHKINIRAEHRVETRLLERFRAEAVDKDLVVQLLQAAIDNPEGQVQDILYPIATPAQMQQLVAQYQKTSRRSYDRQIYTTLRASYGYHYRQMLPVLLELRPGHKLMF